MSNPGNGEEMRCDKQGSRLFPEYT